MFSALFKLNEKKSLEKIETIPLKGKEKVIKEIFWNDFRIIFPALTFLQSEYYIKYGEQQGKRVDVLAFSEEEKTFYLLEYKSEINRGVIEQALTYWNACQEDANRYHLRDIGNDYLRKQKKKEGKLEGFEGADMKIVCLSPFFTEYQKGAQDKRISLVKITKYENEVFHLESKNAKLFEGDGKARTKPTEKPKNIKEILDGLNANEGVREKVLGLNSLMTNSFGSSLKGNLVGERFIIYKREREEKNDYLLGIYIRQKGFGLAGHDNELTKDGNERKDGPKQLGREIRIGSEEEYQKIVNLLNSYLKLLKGNAIH